MFIGNCTTPIVKSLRNNVKKSIFDEVNLFGFALIISKIERKLAQMISRIKLVSHKINGIVFASFW